MGNTYLATGRNNDYNLGLGDNTQRTSFTQIGADAAWLVVKFSTYDSTKFGIGIKADGTLWGWGNNAHRQLGGLPDASYNSPTQIGSATDWVDVALGAYHMVARKADGTLWSCGNNAYGQCGLGHTTSPVTSLTQVGSATDWADIVVANTSCYALKTGGALYAWGANGSGQIGNGSYGANVTSPTQEATASTLWVEVAAGGEFAFGRRSNGTLFGWGQGSRNGVGTALLSTPTQIGSGTDWARVAAGWNTGHAVKTGGTLWSWGQGSGYVLGTGNTTNQTTPVQIGSDTDWADAWAGGPHFIAQKTSGALYGVGSNAYGELGLGSTTSPITSLTLITLAAGPDIIGGGTHSTLIGYTGGIPAPEDITTPIAIHVGPVADLTTPITIVVLDIGDITTSIAISVHTVADITMPITVNVYDPAVFNSAAVTTQSGQSWTCRVVLDGDDVSDHLTGAVEVDAEADAARVASFSLRMIDPFDPAQWLGAAVTVDYVIDTTSWRLMTGTVSETQVDIAGAIMNFTCSDERNTIVAAASASQAEAITPLAYHSSLLSGAKPSRGSSYLRQRMTNLAADLDLSPLGQVRVSSWFEDSSPRKTFTESDIYDGSAGVRVAISPADALADAGAGKIIKVVVEYRYQRLRRARMNVAWSAGGLDSDDLPYLPYPEVVLEAVNSLTEGWKAARMVLTLASPEWVGAAQKVQQMSARLERRWVQDVTETRTYTVRETGTSTAAPVTSTINVGISVSHDEAAWVDRGEVIQITEPGSDLVAEANASIRATINAARKDLLTDRRAHSVSFDVPLDPTLDLPHTYGLDTTHITAAGKASRVHHVMDFDTGAATTTLTLALFGDPTSAVAELGDSNHIIPSLAVLDDDVADLVFQPPAMPTQIVVMPPYGSPPDWDQSGWAVEVHKIFSSAAQSDTLTEWDIGYGRIHDITGKILSYRVDVTYRYDVAKSQFRIDVPEIPAEHTDPADLSVSEDFGMTLPASRFIINT